METVLTLDNERLKAEFFADGSAEIHDKTNDVTWKMGPVALQDKGLISDEVVWPRLDRVWADYFIGRFRVERSDDGLRVKVMAPPWRDEDQRGEFLAKWSLDGDALVLRIEQIDERLPSLNFPPPIECASLILPQGVGRWIRGEQPGMACTFAAQNNGLNMRWVGGLAADENAGWMMIFEDLFAESGTYRSGPMICPTWLKTKHRWAPTRSVRYRFTKGGYVPQTKIFRQWAIDHGIHRGLREKIDHTPALGNLLGGRILSMFQSCTNHAASREERQLSPLRPQDRARDGQLDVRITHRDAARIVELAKSWGMRKGLFNLRGTFSGGYDESHPDIWPPEPALGTIDELKAVINQPDPFLIALHDNVQDVYPRTPTFPQHVIRTSHGHLLSGGYWRGGLCYIACASRQKALAAANWEKVKTLGVRGYFVDTVACVRFYECFDESHPTTRSEDCQYKLELMKFYKDQGVVFGSEEASDFGIPYLDFLENRHNAVPGESIPIWPLVFHDAVFCARYGSGGPGGGVPQRQLENYLWGYMNYWPVQNLASFPGQEHTFKQSLALDEFHARIGLDELTTHRYVGGDPHIEQTEFSSGVSVIANFAKENREVQGHLIPAQGHIVIS